MNRKYELGVMWGYSGSAITYIKLGRDSDARENVTKLLKIAPNFNLDSVRKSQPFKDPAHIKEIIDALRKAGIPEYSPKG